MTFTIEFPKIPSTDLVPPRTPSLVADRRLYLASDSHTLVEAGDVEGAWLLCAAGHSIPGPDVERLGLSLVDGCIVQRAESPSEPTETPEPTADPGAAGDGKKSRLPNENKIRQPDETKSRGTK